MDENNNILASASSANSKISTSNAVLNKKRRRTSSLSFKQNIINKLDKLDQVSLNDNEANRAKVLSKEELEQLEENTLDLDFLYEAVSPPSELNEKLTKSINFCLF